MRAQIGNTARLPCDLQDLPNPIAIHRDAIRRAIILCRAVRTNFRVSAIHPTKRDNALTVPQSNYWLRTNAPIVARRFDFQPATPNKPCVAQPIQSTAEFDQRYRRHSMRFHRFAIHQPELITIKAKRYPGDCDCWLASPSPHDSRAKIANVLIIPRRSLHLAQLTVDELPRHANCRPTNLTKIIILWH